MADQPVNDGKPWTPVDVKKLRDDAAKGKTTPDIARDLGRSKDAVYKKASEEHIPLMPKDPNPHT
jgi:hypothetical protein